MTMMKSGFGQFLLIQRKKRRFRINMSSLCKGWEGRPFTHKERVGNSYLISASSLIVFQMLIVDQCVSFPYGPAAADCSAVCLLPTGV